MIGSKPFRLYRFSLDDIHLCPVRALARWIKSSTIESGYLFRNIDAMDRVSTEDKHINASAFLELFRNNLIDVNQDPHAFGTHSLRRGGCQWLARDRRWSIPQICNWGGWSLDFTHLTIVRYLISWNDGLDGAREDYFNPNRPPAIKCHYCGRSCWHV
ncbi:hypothetical protein BDZ97DRAFT_1668784 [Flammula alnicola]|nr:hypothetical protein BDZ97DRAFT_1668784 [Flammula alnicola]